MAIEPALASAGKQCDLGTDPSKYLETFEAWYEHHHLLADSIGITDPAQELKLLLLWGGRDFRQFAKSAGVVMEGDGRDAKDEAIRKIRDKCVSHVNLSMAMYNLMHNKQGTKSVTEYAKAVEELSVLCMFDEKPYTKERAKRDAFIFGTSDDKLRHEVLVKDLDFNDTLKTALSYEQSTFLCIPLKQFHERFQDHTLITATRVFF